MKKSLKFNCCICGGEESAEKWIKETADELVEHQLCFKCNCWRQQHDLDLNVRGEHNYAIVNGKHFVLDHDIPSGPFKGCGGHKFTFEFFDGTVVECNNVWYQGDLKKAAKHWRDLMPDNARIITRVIKHS